MLKIANCVSILYWSGAILVFLFLNWNTKLGLNIKQNIKKELFFHLILQ